MEVGSATVVEFCLHTDPPSLEFLSLPRDDGELLPVDDELVSRETASASEIRVVCYVCGASCLDSVDLDQHAKLHSSNIVYGCAYCKAQFSKPAVLLWHMKQHIPGLHTFSSCASLAEHGTFRRLNELTCGFCRENFEGVESFDAHVLNDDAGKVDGDTQVNVPINTLSEESPASISAEAAIDAAEEIVSTSSFGGLSTVNINQSIFKIISVVPNSHSCLICQQVFTSHEALFRHTYVHPLIHIAELGAPSCGICETRFRDAAELHRHVQREAEATGLNTAAALNESSQADLSGSLILTVLKNNAATYSSQNSCGSEDLGNEEFTESLHIVGENLDEREIETYANKASAKKRRNGESVSVPGDFYVCSHCNRSFVNVQGLLCHLKMHTEGRPFKCLHCGDSFRFAKRLAVHARVFHKITLCSRCGKEECHCSDKTQANDSKASYPCLRCKRVFARVTALQRHELTHLRGIVHVCDICGKRFGDRSQFSRHLALHNGRQYRCETCKKDFSSDVILRDHMKTHSDDRPLTCNICGKHFKWRNALRVHLNKHYGSAFQCYVCGRSFTTKSYLMTHVEMHNGPRVKAFTCNFCDKAYFDKSALRKHHATHAENRIRPFACEICGKSFLANNNLQTHLKLHRNERLHKCDKCEKSFNMKGHLKRHMSVHSKNVETSCDSPIVLPVGDVYHETCEEVVIDSVVAVV